MDNIQKLEKKNFTLSIFYMFWILSFYALCLNLSPGITQDIYDLRQFFSVPILVLVIIYFYRDIMNKEIPGKTAWILLPIISNVIALMIQAISIKIFFILCASYIIGFFNVFQLPFVRKSLVYLIVFSILVGIISDQLYSFYIDGRTRLTFLFATPTLLAILCSIGLFIVGFKNWARIFCSLILLIIIYFSGTKSAFYTLILLLPASVLIWHKDGKNRLNLVKCIVLVHVLIVTSTILFLYFGLKGSLADQLNSILSGRLYIWMEAVRSVGFFGGVDANLDWIRGGIEKESALTNRASMDGYYILRWAESGFLALSEYFLICYAVIQAAKVAPVEELQIIIFLFVVGLIETIGIGFGNLPALLFTSLLLNNGLINIKKAPLRH